MGATGGRVGTGAGLGFFSFFSVEDLPALCMDASKTPGNGLSDFFRFFLQDLRSGMYLQLHNMQVTNKQK